MSDWVRYLENKKLWTCTPRSIPPPLRVSILLSLFSCFFLPSFSLLPPSVTSVCTHAGKRAYAARGNNGGFHGVLYPSPRPSIRNIRCTRAEDGHPPPIFVNQASKSRRKLESCGASFKMESILIRSVSSVER